jgi:hypothetical protein
MFNRALIAAAASFSIVLAGTAGADDTDIYLDPDTAGGDALVMFTLDNRPSTTSTYGGCSNVGSAGSYCNAAQAFVNLGIAASDLPASSSPLTFLDALRLALKVAFSRLPSSASGIMPATRTAIPRRITTAASAPTSASASLHWLTGLRPNLIQNSRRSVTTALTPAG